jgi:lipopolysaccharide biosynthesis regulator YciM
LWQNVSEKKPLKKISAKAIMVDLKAGLSDSQLMTKYGLSFQGLQDLFSKLVNAGLATKAYFEKRALQHAGSPQMSKKVKTCPYCGFSSEESFVKCPRCKQDTTEWLDTVELTKILTGSFD